MIRDGDVFYCVLFYCVLIVFWDLGRSSLPVGKPRGRHTIGSVAVAGMVHAGMFMHSSHAWT